MFCGSLIRRMTCPLPWMSGACAAEGRWYLYRRWESRPREFDRLWLLSFSTGRWYLYRRWESRPRGFDRLWLLSCTATPPHPAAVALTPRWLAMASPILPQTANPLTPNICERRGGSVKAAASMSSPRTSISRRRSSAATPLRCNRTYNSLSLADCMTRSCFGCAACVIRETVAASVYEAGFPPCRHLTSHLWIRC